VFDLRYHVASLAAVFLALVVGILVGAAISDPSLGDRARAEQLRGQVERLERELEAEQLRSDEEEASEDYLSASYDAVMDGRLDGQRVAVLYVGGVDAALGIEQAVEAAGGDVARMRAIDVPVDAEALIQRVQSTEEGAAFEDAEDVEALGRALGEEFVAGGEAPLWESLTGELVQERVGDLDEPVDAVVVARTERAQSAATGRFVSGLFEGVSGPVPAVGVESSREIPSAVTVYRRAGLSIVDNVDNRLGKISLAVLLAGGEPGHYGLRDSRDAAVPPIEPVEPQPEPGE
jgi:predicted Zn-dependent protease with MMP-like domain